MSPGSSREWVTIAVLGKTRGNRGELTAVPLTSKLDRFEKLTRVYLFGPGAEAGGHPCEVEETWFHDATLIFKFAGIDSISDAERLTGSEVRVPVAERVTLEAGEFFQEDLIGCAVVERSGQPVGTVTAFDEGGGPAGLLVVGDLLIPFAKSICAEIDVAARRIVVDLPPGLKDLNRP